jgi:hypothetical protein
MEVKIICPNPSCRQHIALDDSWRGRSMPCPACGTTLKVPLKSSADPNKAPANTGNKTKMLLWAGIGCVAFAIIGATAFALSKKHQKKVAEQQRIQELKTQARISASQPSWATNTLYVAAHDGKLDEVREMLDAHPEVINQGIGGARSTLLHTAAYNGRTAVVNELLKRKADVNVRNTVGHTPLWDCVDNRGNPDILTMLITNGADVSIPDNKGQTPLQVAIRKNRTEMAELLRQHGAKE